ncbi:O-antigen/teichoic acid export membrane protein [Rhodobacteraceae bacterium MBR-64]
MRRWFADGAFRAVMRNASYLGAAKALAAPLGLIALAAAGRGMTPEMFGLLMVVHAYALGAGTIVKFQTWQVIIRYAAPALARKDRGVARDAIRFALGLDLLSAGFGMAGAMALLPFIGGKLGIDAGVMPLALIYCTLIPTMSAATPTGVLRVLDRFDLIGAQQLVTPAVRALGAAICYFWGLGFTGFMVAWYVGDLAGDLVLWALAARELRRHDLMDAFRPGLVKTARRLPGAWGFAWTTNLAHSLYAAWGPVSNLVVAAVLGPAAAGLYKIATTLLDSAKKPADLVSRSFFPEVMRLDPASKHPWRLGLRVGIIAGAVGLVLVGVVMIAGRPLIGFAFGEEYLEAFGLMQIMTWALVVSMATFQLESLLYMVGRQVASLVARSVGTAIYLVILYVLGHLFGLTGVGFAFLLGTIVMAGFMLALTLQSFARRADYAQPELVARH